MMLRRSGRNDVEYGARRSPRAHHDHAGGPSLDHLVCGGQQRFWDGEAECWAPPLSDVRKLG
jgi:hypothetical protein